LRKQEELKAACADKVLNMRDEVASYKLKISEAVEKFEEKALELKVGSLYCKFLLAFEMRRVQSLGGRLLALLFHLPLTKNNAPLPHPIDNVQ